MAFFFLDLLHWANPHHIVWLADHFVDTVIANFETFDPACQNPQIYEAFDNVINAAAA